MVSGRGNERSAEPRTSTNDQAEEAILKEMLAARKNVNVVTRANAFSRWGKDLVYYRTDQHDLMSDKARGKCGIHIPAKPKKAPKANAPAPEPTAKAAPKKKITFDPHDFVWAQSHGCPWWPAQIIDPLNILEDEKDKKDKKDQVDIPASILKGIPQSVQDVLDDASAGVSRKSSSRMSKNAPPTDAYMHLVRYFGGSWDWISQEGLAHMFDVEYGNVKKSKIDEVRMAEAGRRKKSVKARIEVGVRGVPWCAVVCRGSCSAIV